MRTWRRLLRSENQHGRRDIFSPGHKNCGIPRPHTKTNLRQMQFANVFCLNNKICTHKKKIFWRQSQNRGISSYCNNLRKKLVCKLGKIEIFWGNEQCLMMMSTFWSKSFCSLSSLIGIVLYSHEIGLFNFQRSNWRFFSFSKQRSQRPYSLTYEYHASKLRKPSFKKRDNYVIFLLSSGGVGGVYRIS